MMSASLGAEPSWRRHPADLARLVFALVVALLFVAVTALVPSTVIAVSEDLFALFGNVPAALRAFIIGLVQVIAVAVPVVVVGHLVLARRGRLLGLLALAALLAAVVMAVLNSWLADRVPSVALDTQRVDSWITGAAFPSTTYLAAGAAMATAGARWLRRPWRRATWIALGVGVVSRVLTATEAPLNIGMVLALGSAAGSAALLVLGAPARRTDEATILAALGRVDLGLEDLTVAGRPTGRPTFEGRAVDGQDVAVHVIGRDERDTDLLLRAWRSVTVKGLGDRRPSRSATRAAEHEALTLSLARSAGVRVPQLQGIAYTDEGVGIVVLTRESSTPLIQLSSEDLDDGLLADAWSQVDRLHRRRIAHRDLDARSVVRYADGPGLQDFSQTSLDASDELLGVDVANLLVSLALIVGAERAVRSARDGIGADALAAAAPFVQHVVLSPAVRRGLTERKDLLAELRQTIADTTGIGAVEPEQLRRVTLKGVVSLVGGLVLAGYVLSLVSNWSDIWEAVKEAEPRAIGWLLLLSTLSYVGGALSMMGSVTVELPFLRSTEVMFAQSFLNRFTPANAGGMALRARYLQLQGCDVTVAAAAVGLASAASGVMQALFVVVFLVWGGSTSELGSFSLPDKGVVLAVVVVVAAVVGGLLLSGWGRAKVLPTVRRTLGKALASFRDLARRPDRLGLLFGGAGLGKLVTVLAFVVSVRAFDVDMGLAQAGALYMVANTIGSAVPTPGGVGGLEAALTAALLGANVDPATAAAIVLLFRLMTFWLPTVPGWFFLRHAQRTGVV